MTAPLLEPVTLGVMDVPTLERNITIAASPEQVWELVRDVTRMPEWSPFVESTRLKGDGVAMGVRFANRNRQDGMDWVTTARSPNSSKVSASPSESMRTGRSGRSRCAPRVRARC